MKLLATLFFLLFLAAGGLFVYGVDQKRQADNRPDQSWTAKFWEKEKNNLIQWKTEAYLKLPSADKGELILWLDNQLRKERLSNQNNEEKWNLDSAIGAILNDLENRKHYAKFKHLSSDDRSKFMTELGRDEALLFRQWMNDEKQRFSSKPI